MATWTSFYIQYDDLTAIEQELKELSGIQDAFSGTFPNDLHEYYLANENTNPTYLVVGKTQEGWVTVVHNSFSKLSEWSTLLSQKFETKVIVTGAQSVSSYYYFALYENGLKLRELEFCYSDDFKSVNFGNRLWFEGEEPGTKEEFDGEIEYFFGFEDIDNYCKQLGLTIQLSYSEFTWLTLKKEAKQKTVKDVISELGTNKPWWKFWQ